MPDRHDTDGPVWGPWTFESAVTTPDGIEVRVSVAVPSNAVWEDVGETGEIAQMAASRAIAQIRSNKNACYERAPF